MIEIIVKKGIVPVHSFDLMGPIINIEEMSNEQLKAYKQIAPTMGISREDMNKTIENYTALKNKEPWALGERKQGIIDGIRSPLKQAGYKQDVSQMLYQDGIKAIREIFDAGEQAILFSSKSFDTNNLPEGLGERIRFYKGDKTKLEPFQEVYGTEARLGNQIVTHTADEIPELVIALQVGISPQGVFFVDRNQKTSREAVYEKGIQNFITNLSQPNYTRIVKTQ